MLAWGFSLELSSVVVAVSSPREEKVVVEPMPWPAVAKLITSAVMARAAKAARQAMTIARLCCVRLCVVLEARPQRSGAIRVPDAEVAQGVVASTRDVGRSCTAVASEESSFGVFWSAWLACREAVGSFAPSSADERCRIFSADLERIDW